MKYLIGFVVGAFFGVDAVVGLILWACDKKVRTRYWRDK